MRHKLIQQKYFQGAVRVELQERKSHEIIHVRDSPLLQSVPATTDRLTQNDLEATARPNIKESPESSLEKKIPYTGASLEVALESKRHFWDPALTPKDCLLLLLSL